MSGYAVTLIHDGSSQAFIVQDIHGPDDVDEINLVVGMDGKALDGSHPQNIIAFQRIITIDFGVVLDKTLRVWLAAFARSNDQHVVYAGEDIPVSLLTANAFGDEYVQGFQEARRYVVRLIEAVPRVGIPVAWGANPWITWGQVDITPLGDVGYTFASLP